MNPHRNANIKANNSPRAVHFSIRLIFPRWDVTASSWAMLVFVILSHGDYYFSSRVAFFEIPHRLRGLAQLVSPVDDGCLPRLHEVAQQLQILFVQFRDITDELLTDEPRQQIRFEIPNYTPPRFRV